MEKKEGKKRVVGFKQFVKLTENASVQNAKKPNGPTVRRFVREITQLVRKRLKMEGKRR
mgnify:FL=1